MGSLIILRELPNAFISFNVFSMKKPLDDLTKAKYIYSGELLAFSVAFTVLGILTMTGVIGVSENRVNWITWITLVGGSLLIANTIWFFCSKKKRAKGSWLDTLIILPVPLTMIPLDIIHLTSKAVPDSAYAYILGGLFFYLTMAYVTEAIYHWFNPLQVLVEAAKEDEEKKEEGEAKEEIADKTPSDSENE